MIEKVIKIVVLFSILIVTPYFVFADGQPPSSSSKNGNFSKNTFSKDNSWSRNGKALAPPDPNAGTGGNRIPISGGLAFLLLGSSAYLIKRIHEENK